MFFSTNYQNTLSMKQHPSCCQQTPLDFVFYEVTTFSDALSAPAWQNSVYATGYQHSFLDGTHPKYIDSDFFIGLYLAVVCEKKRDSRAGSLNYGDANANAMPLVSLL